MKILEKTDRLGISDSQTIQNTETAANIYSTEIVVWQKNLF